MIRRKMKNNFIQLIAIFLLMMVTGVFWGTWFSLTQSLDDFSAAEFIHNGKIIIANLAFPMRIIFPLCVIFTMLTVYFYPNKKSTTFYFALLGFALIIGALLVTLFVEVPIDNQIKMWSAETIPSDWEAMRNKWSTFHTTRTFLSLASFGLFSASIIFSKHGEPD